MTIGEFKAHELDTERGHYPGFIDILAYNMNWVSYKKYQGEDRYYTKTYTDNYIRVPDDNYQNHLSLSLQQQEEKITKHLISRYSKKHHEFITESPIGYLTPFSRYCSFNNINFHHARVLLLDLISQLEPNNWYSTESLIYYLKLNHPYFIIPRKPESVRAAKEKDRYKGIYTTDAGYSEVKQSDKKAFEKVEGRYVERFLEYIPFIMGYAEIAYDFSIGEKTNPSIGQLVAFKPTSKLFRYRNKSIEEAKIIVQPNFEISIESEIYPTQIMHELISLGKLIKKDVVTQVKIEKNKVIQKVAKEPSFNPVEYLTKIAKTELPNNLKIELEEWAGQSDAFVIYEDMYLFESQFQLPSVKNLIIDKIDNNLSIIKKDSGITNELEEKEALPIKKLVHKDTAFLGLDTAYKSIFVKSKNTKKKILKNLEKLEIKKEIIIKLLFPNTEQLNIISGCLLKKGCVFSVNNGEKSITLSQKNEPMLKEVLKDAGKQFQLDITDK
jgi:hypothetical protein